MVVPKPTDINNWMIWGDLTESVLLKYETDVWDKDQKEYYIEIEHRPTKLMRYINQIENSKETTYDRVTDKYKIRLPMSKVAIIKARTDGDYILMLCDFRGTMTNMVEIINKRLLDENTKLRAEIKTANAQIIRTKALMEQFVKHPEQVWSSLIKLQRKIGQGTAPAVISGQPMNPTMEENGQ